MRGLVRRPSIYPFTESGITLFKGHLPDEIDPAAFDQADVVIHAAYTTTMATREEAHRVNDLGTRRVYEMSQRTNVGQFVFISSIGAHAQAESYYGKSKYALEQILDPAKDLIICPGLIVGPGEGGAFHRMKETLRATGVVPIFDGGHQILQVIDIDDLCTAIDLALQKRLTGRLVVAEPEGQEMKEFFKKLAARLHTRCRLVPLPLGLMLMALRLIEKLRIPLPLSSENLLGLKHLKHVPSAEDLAKIGLTVKSADQSLHNAIP